MGLLDALLGNATSNLVEQGIESAGERGRRARRQTSVFVLTLLIAAWTAVASALLWSDERLPNVTGLWQFAQTSGPGWALATPTCALLLVLVLLIPVSGRLTIAVGLATAVFGFGLASIATLQQGGRSAVSVVTLISILLTFALPLLTLLLALGDAPPIDSFAARISLVYWGRLGHLRALKQYAITHNIAVSEPHGSLRPLTLTGFYDNQHPITIASGASFKLSTRNGSSFTLTAWMGSPRDIVAFRISSRPPSKQQSAFLVGQTGARLQRKLYIFVVPEPSIPVPPGVMERLTQLIEAGRSFLGPYDYLHATPMGMRYLHRASLGLSKRDAQLDPLLQWMHDLIAVFEPISPPGPPSPSGA